MKAYAQTWSYEAFKLYICSEESDSRFEICLEPLLGILTYLLRLLKVIQLAGTSSH